MSPDAAPSHHAVLGDHRRSVPARVLRWQSESAAAIPYLLDVQADLLDTLATRVVVPLILEEEMGLATKHLNPQFKIKGTSVVMSTSRAGGCPQPFAG